MSSIYPAFLSDGTKPATGDFNLNNHKVTNVTDPTNPQDSATKNYVDTATPTKLPVRVATTGNITISSATTTIDGTLLNVGDRVLVKNQTTASQNGIYTAGGVGDAWVNVASMANIRYTYGGALLQNGNYLVGGGVGTGFAIIATSEVYNPFTNTWTTTGSLNTPRARSIFITLNDGTVLAVAGTNGGTIASCEKYDPGSGTWSVTGSLATPRQQFTAHLITSGSNSGKVLAIGGLFSGSGLTSMEIYDPGAGTWSAAPSIPEAIYAHSSTKVTIGGHECILVAALGKQANSMNTYYFDVVTSTWSSAISIGTIVWSLIGNMMTTLSNGKALLAGGADGIGFRSTAYLFNPTTQTWAATGSLGTARDSSLIFNLTSGKVLYAGGSTVSYNDGDTSVEIYDPVATTFSFAGSLNTARCQGPYMTGSLVATNYAFFPGGGDSSGNPLSSAERYTPGTAGSWTRTVDTLTNGTIVSVYTGTFNAGTAWELTQDGPITVGTTSLTFDKVNVLPTPTIFSYTASTGSPFTPNAAKYDTISITVDANLTVDGPSNPTDGQKIIFRLINDASHAVTFATGAGNFEFGTTFSSYTATASKIDYVGVIYDSTANLWHIVSLSQGF